MTGTTTALVVLCIFFAAAAVGLAAGLGVVVSRQDRLLARPLLLAPARQPRPRTFPGRLLPPIPPAAPCPGGTFVYSDGAWAGTYTVTNASPYNAVSVTDATQPGQPVLVGGISDKGQTTNATSWATGSAPLPGDMLQAAPNYKINPALPTAALPFAFSNIAIDGDASIVVS